MHPVLAPKLFTDMIKLGLLRFYVICMLRVPVFIVRLCVQG